MGSGLFYTGAIISFVFAYIIHRGAYPEPLPPVDNRLKAYIEIALIYLPLVGSAIYFNTVGTRSWGYFLYIPISLIVYAGAALALAFVVELLIGEGSLQHLGFQLPINWPLSLAIVLFSFIFGAAPALFGGGAAKPSSLDLLIFGLIVPALVEEVCFRGLIQTRLEELHGPILAWIIGGILFGLWHIPTDFWGTMKSSMNLNLTGSLGLLLLQIGNGMIMGVLYIKTRSLLPCILAHYLGSYSDDLIMIFVRFFR